MKVLHIAPRHTPRPIQPQSPNRSLTAPRKPAESATRAKTVSRLAKREDATINILGLVLIVTRTIIDQSDEAIHPERVIFKVVIRPGLAFIVIADSKAAESADVQLSRQALLVFLSERCRLQNLFNGEQRGPKQVLRSIIHALESKGFVIDGWRA